MNDAAEVNTTEEQKSEVSTQNETMAATASSIEEVKEQPIQAPVVQSAPTPDQNAIIIDLRQQMGDLNEKLTEISAQYVALQLHSKTQIAELKVQLEQEKLKAAELVQAEELQRQLRDEQYALAEKEKQIEALREEHKIKFQEV